MSPIPVDIRGGQSGRLGSGPLALLALCALWSTACGGDNVTEPSQNQPEPVVATIEITPQNDTLTAFGETRQLVAVAKDAAGGVLTGKTLSWTSSDGAVADVDSTGLVTARGEGNTTITAAVAGVSGSATLTVVQVASGLSVQVQPSDAESGAPFPVQPVVELIDASGNRIAQDDSTIVTARVGVGGGTLLGTFQVTVAGGLATFGDLGISGSAGERTLEFTASGYAPAASDTFYLNLGQSTSDTIGTTGGAVRLANGASIAFPANAIRGEVLVQFTDSSDVVPYLAGLSDHGYTIELSVLGVNTTYSRDDSVRLTLPIDPARISGGELYIRAVFENLPDESFFASAELVGGDSLTIMLPADGLAELETALLGNRLFVYAEEFVPNTVGTPAPGSSAVRGANAAGFADEVVGCNDYPLVRSTSSKEAAPGLDVAIILVHGWDKRVFDCDSFEDQQTDPFFPTLPGSVYLEKLLAVLELEVGDQHPIYLFTYPSFRTYDTSGEELGRKIEALYETEQFGGVILVGHSMGGLVSRQAVRYLVDSGSADLVRGVITLGTPHFGTPLPRSRWAKVFFPLALAAEGGQSLLRGMPEEEEAPIFAYGGNIANRTDVDHLTHNKICDLLGDPDCRSDGFVPLQSAVPSFVGMGWINDYTHAELHEGNGDSPDDLYIGILDNISRLRGGSIIVSGEVSNCALIRGTAFCWGNGWWGQLGNGSSGAGHVEATPVRVSASFNFASVTASPGGWHTCGLTVDGAAYCWGNGGWGQLGNGSSGIGFSGALGYFESTPVPVSGGLTFATLAAGDHHTCGVTTQGVTYCWGSGKDGRLGTGLGGITYIEPTPVRVATDLIFQSLTASFEHTCGVTVDGEAHCWGHALRGRLGNGVDMGRLLLPVPVSGGLVFESLAAAQGYTCGVTVEQVGYCWGSGQPGGLGNGSTNNQLTPFPVAGGLRFTQISVGVVHTCGITIPNGDAYCWGWGARGALGDGVSGDGHYRTVPTLVLGGLSFQSISAGVLHTCGMTDDTEIFCWGANSYGQLGNGSIGSENIATPVRVWFPGSSP
jgi:alpha-tubulin suppressor-like RCC1 family protein/pimeloyl-ACP methyl ester carboxylesterase